MENAIKPTHKIGFSGSYKPEDITFLLKPVEMEATSVSDKEKAIQSGTRHYSEMISYEKAPGADYMSIFEDAMAGSAERMGKEVAELAQAISAQIDGPITLASLVRAGAPLGVLLFRALKVLGHDVEHFGISIIRDRGLDRSAMEYMIETRPSAELIFVDGWTGKGAISGELARSFSDYSDEEPKMVVLADPCGKAWLAASGEDWLIPSGILGSTVSGLISRTILNDDVVGPDDFHACVKWDHLAEHDISRQFIEQVWQYTAMSLETAVPSVWSKAKNIFVTIMAEGAVNWVVEKHNVTNINRVKPGIAEATRAILRRMPEKVFVSSPDDPELAALMHLIEKNNVPYEVVPEQIEPYRAITLIRKVS